MSETDKSVSDASRRQATMRVSQHKRTAGYGAAVTLRSEMLVFLMSSHERDTGNELAVVRVSVLPSMPSYDMTFSDDSHQRLFALSTQQHCTTSTGRAVMQYPRGNP